MDEWKAEVFKYNDINDRVQSIPVLMTTFALPFGFSFNPNSMHTVTFSTFYVVKFQGNFFKGASEHKKNDFRVIVKNKVCKIWKGIDAWSKHRNNIALILLASSYYSQRSCSIMQWSMTSMSHRWRISEWYADFYWSLGNQWLIDDEAFVVYRLLIDYLFITNRILINYTFLCILWCCIK